MKIYEWGGGEVCFSTTKIHLLVNYYLQLAKR